MALVAAGAGLLAALRPDSGRSAVPAGEAAGVLRIRSAPNTYYVPRYTRSGRAPLPTQYQVDLGAAAAAPGTARGAVRRIRVTFGLAALLGKTEIWGVNKGYGCVRSGVRVTCSLHDIDFGEGALLVPFSVKPAPAAQRGPAGDVTITVRSANAPTVHHTTRVIVGSPYLTARQHSGTVTGVRPGGEVRLTPGFGNKGDTDVDGGISVLVSVSDATLLPRYGNCRYDKSKGATKAQCDFPGPLRAGTAYEATGPFTAVAGRTARSGSVGYGVWRTGDLDYRSRLPASAPRGSGAPLGLRPVDGTRFTGVRLDAAQVGTASLDFETTRLNDLEPVGFAIKGKVGQVVDTQVPYPRSYGRSAVGNPTMWVTLPEGVSLVPVDPESHSGDFLYCAPGPKKGGPVACPGPEVGGTFLRVRIDRRVEGARGSISVASDPAVDPDQRNNTAPVTVEYAD
ncbi:hypothetical protein ACF1A5_13895 [Streptomyces sp. NPDC014864]|uniref:hypothetical protein n=1 Tax=Streptomyces sp. NPDC014864 TaxID=3364924 RepID=UPI0036F7CF9C